MNDTEPVSLYYLQDAYHAVGDVLGKDIETEYRLDYGEDWLRVTSNNTEVVEVHLHRNAVCLDIPEAQFTDLVSDEYVHAVHLPNDSTPLGRLLDLALDAAWWTIDTQEPIGGVAPNEDERVALGGDAITLLTASSDSLHEMLDEWIDESRPSVE